MLLTLLGLICEAQLEVGTSNILKGFTLQMCDDLLNAVMQIKMGDVIVVSVYGLHGNSRRRKK